MKLKKEFETTYQKEIDDFLKSDKMSYSYREFIVKSFEKLADELEKDIDNITLTKETIEDTLMPIAGGGSGFQWDMIMYMLYRYWYYEQQIIRED